MKKATDIPAHPDDGEFDRTVRQQLEEIQKEATPERLLILAKELQRLLREKNL